MKAIIRFIAQSPVVQVLITCVVYAVYAAIMGLSLLPSVAGIVFGIQRFPPGTYSAVNLIFFCFIVGAAVYIYFITGVVVMGMVIRILSLGVRPGKYSRASVTMLRWLVYSGIYHLAGTTILTFVPMTFLTNLFFKLTGAKIGKNVYINTWFLNDAYLMEIGDNVVIGGKTDVSCHTFEDDCLILGPIKIGEGALIGTRCYIGPGVTIGKQCRIGMCSFLRKNTVLPDKTFISSLAGMPVRDVAVLENIGSRRGKAGSRNSNADAVEP